MESKGLLSARAARETLRALRFRGRTMLRRGAMPNTIIIGAMKGGTTSVFNYLSQHPNVCASTTKEVHYFDNRIHKGENWYRAHFSPRANQSVVVEASPYYLFHPLAPTRVRKAIPDAKLIVLLREPSSRAHSHYRHSVRHKFETLPFAEALAAEAERIGEDDARLARGEISHSPAHQHFSYFQRGLYAMQLERWFAEFPREDFLILRSENLFGSARETMDQVLDFLALPLFEFPDLTPKHQTPKPKKASDSADTQIREGLKARFEAPNAELEQLTGIRWGGTSGR